MHVCMVNAGSQPQHTGLRPLSCSDIVTAPVDKRLITNDF